MTDIAHIDFASFTAGETLIWYDQPVLYTVTDPAGRLYLAVFVDETDKTQTFLYAPISAGRYTNLQSGRLPLRDAYTQPDGTVWKVVFDFTDDEFTVDVAAADTPLCDEWLPAPDVTLPARQPAS